MRRLVLCVLLLAMLFTGTAQSGHRSAPDVRAAGTLIVDGRPYFPVFSWAACPQDVDRDLAAGVNVFMHHGEGCGGESGFLGRLGQRGYYIPELGDGTDFASDPRLLGYVQPDEPDGHDIGPGELGAAPGRVVYMTLTARFVHALPRFHDEAARALYEAYRAKADMLGVAVYPLSHLCGVAGLAAVYDVQRDLVAFAGVRPTFQWIETGSLEGACGAPVTPAALTAEAWLAVAGGARGLGWFTYGWPGGRAQSFDVDPDIAAAMGTQSARIQRLAPALLAPATDLAAGPDEPVKLGGRSYAGMTYVIAASSVDVPVHWERALPGLANKTVTVLEEHRAIRASGGVLRDAFAPLGVHIYAYKS